MVKMALPYMIATLLGYLTIIAKPKPLLTAP